MVRAALAAALLFLPNPSLRADNAPPAKGDKADKVEAKPTTTAGVAQFVAKHKGKPVLFDVWATWCAPCLQKFPKFVALAAKHKGKVQFASLSLDGEEEAGKANAFLTSQKAPFPHLRLTGEAAPLEAKYQFEGVPQYLLFDAAGKFVLATNKLEKAEEKLVGLLAR